ncbi:MAG: helix-turn-helix transcriptional regulator [Deltaproteobacteria bacterium]|nr:helix-turn-helix transcriptional regulator [Deltaproteobacteria bacterium]
MKELKTRLGRRIRMLRKNAGLTQERLGERANLSYKYIGEVERGGVNISIESLMRIAEAVDVNIGRLFDEGDLAVGKTALKKAPAAQTLSHYEIRTIKKTLGILLKMTSGKRD